MIELNIVIAVRGGPDGKSRLAPHLPPCVRRRIVMAMLEDMLTTIRHANATVAIFVVTPTFELAAMAARYGATPILEPTALGLNVAFERARELLRDCDIPVAYLPADLPFLTPGDVRALIALSRGEQRPVLIPACSDGGTGCLLLPPTMEFPFCFGAKSWARHMAIADRLGLNPVIARSAGVGRDIDRISDLFALNARPRRRKTALLFQCWLNGVGKIDHEAA